jgi:hypothetical protein
MRRLSPVCLAFLAYASLASAESDEEIIERVFVSYQNTFLDQASWSLPKSFWNSGLTESDKNAIVKTLAEEGAHCFTNAIKEYAEFTKKPISQIVSEDSTVRFRGDSGTEFMQLFDPCMTEAFAAAGIPKG